MTFPLMLFAAGLGSRMGKLTETCPKPMLPIAGRPLIDHAIDLARGVGISRIVANTHYLPGAISPHLRKREVIESPEQPTILDTGGGLRKARDLLGSGPVLTLNTDAVFSAPNPLSILIDAWKPEMKALLLVVPGDRAMGRKGPGDFTFDGTSLRRGGNHVFTGAQVIDPSVLDTYPEPVFSLSQVWTDLAARDVLHGVAFPGTWVDVGHPEGIALAETLMPHV